MQRRPVWVNRRFARRPMTSGLPAITDTVRRARLVVSCQRRSFGHASYSRGLLQFLDIFEPTKYHFILKAGNAEKGIRLQDSIQARRASAIRPAIARFDISIRCAPGKFGWRWMALVAQDRPSSPGKEMSVGHPGLGQEQVGIDRTQANGCRELLDRRGVIAEINLCPACPKARYHQIGIERHGPSAKAELSRMPPARASEARRLGNTQAITRCGGPLQFQEPLQLHEPMQLQSW